MREKKESRRGHLAATIQEPTTEALTNLGSGHINCTGNPHGEGKLHRPTCKKGPSGGRGRGEGSLFNKLTSKKGRKKEESPGRERGVGENQSIVGIQPIP